MFLVLLLEFFYPSESIFWRPPLSLYYNLCIEAENYTTPYLSSPLCSRTSIVFVDYIFQLPKGESAPLSFLFDYVSPFFFLTNGDHIQPGRSAVRCISAPFGSSRSSHAVSSGCFWVCYFFVSAFPR
jgi:hypothetical protein